MKRPSSSSEFQRKKSNGKYVILKEHNKRQNSIDQPFPSLHYINHSLNIHNESVGGFSFPITNCHWFSYLNLNKKLCLHPKKTLPAYKQVDFHIERRHQLSHKAPCGYKGVSRSRDYVREPNVPSKSEYFHLPTSHMRPTLPEYVPQQRYAN